jgi:S1-C subfamily serine protease
MMRGIVALLVGLVLGLPARAQAAIGEECDKSFSEIFREVSPVVVFITALSVNPFRLRDRMQAGLGAGLMVDGEGMSEIDTVIRLVWSLKVGDRVQLEYVREGMTHSAEVVLPERPVLTR